MPYDLCPRGHRTFERGRSPSCLIFVGPSLARCFAGAAIGALIGAPCGHFARSARARAN